MLDIVLSVEEQGLVGARGYFQGAYTKEHSLGPDFSIKALEAFTTAVHRAALGSRDIGQELLTQAQNLYEAVFRDELEQQFSRAIARANAPLLVRLIIDDARLQKVPWEALCAPGTTEEFLATNAQVHVVRGVTSANSTPSGRPPEKLRLLIIAPQGETGSIEVLRQALSRAIETGVIEWMEPMIAEQASQARIMDRLTTEALPGVIHFMGHGDVGKDGHPRLRLADEDGDEVWVKVERFAQAVKSNTTGDLRLFVLEACEGAEPGVIGSAAEHLARAGVEAVVSFLWPVRAETSLTASTAFYRAFTSKTGTRGNVPASVSAARQALRDVGAIGFSLVAHVCAEAPEVNEAAPVSLAYKAPFLVPFLQDRRFVGRTDDLEKLHALLQDPTNRVCGVRGMGGIGKTQLVIEYVYRYRYAYPDGVFWVNAARDWQSELARLAEKVGIRDQSTLEQERQRQLARAFVEYLEQHRRSLVLFDNVRDPLDLTDVNSDFVPVRLVGQILFTTRRQSGDFPTVEIRPLDDDSSLRLLLDTRARRDILQSHAPELETAREICKMLGNLPLALALASAYLEKRPRLGLRAYCDGLVHQGALPVLDGAGVTSRELPTQHETGLRATLLEQWKALPQEADARRVLQTAALLREAEQIPRAQLSLLTGLADAQVDWQDPPLEKALRELSEWSLIETLTESSIRLHAIVREFAKLTLGESMSSFAAGCAGRMAESLSDMARLLVEVSHRDVDAILGDLQAGIELAGDAEAEVLEPFYRAMDREAHAVRVLGGPFVPGFFLQQLRNRSFEMGLQRLQQLAEAKLAQDNHCWLRERFVVGGESDALVRTLVGHERPLASVAITPNGRYVLSASFDQKCTLWDFHTGQAIRTFVEHTDSVHRAVLTSDGKRAISASLDKTIKIWDIETGAVLRTIEGHGDSVSSIAINSRDDTIVSVSADRTVRKWEFGTGNLSWSVQGHESSGASVIISPDERHAFSGAFDGTIKQWELATGKLVRTFEGYGKSCCPLAMTPDGGFLISGNENGALVLIDIESGEVIPVKHEHTVSAVNVTPDGRHIVMGSEGGTMGILELETGKVVRTFQGHTACVTDVAITKDGNFAVSASFDTTLKIWNLESLDTDRAAIDPDKHTVAINDVAFSTDNQFVLSGSEDGTMKLWNVADGRVIRTFGRIGSSVAAVAMSNDGTLVASATWTGEFTVWNANTGEMVRQLEQQVPSVRDLAISGDARHIFAMTYDNTLIMWDLETGRAIPRPRSLASYDTAGGSSPLGIWDKKIRVRDVKSGQTIVVDGGPTRVDNVALTPDRQLLITASGDEKLHIWSVQNGKLLKTLTGHTRIVKEAVVTPDGQFIISVSLDRTVRLWHIETGKQVAHLEASAPLNCCAISSDGKTILIGDAGGGLHVVDWIRGNLETVKRSPRRPSRQ